MFSVALKVILITSLRHSDTGGSGAGLLRLSAPELTTRDRSPIPRRNFCLCLCLLFLSTHLSLFPLPFLLPPLWGCDGHARRPPSCLPLVHLSMAYMACRIRFTSIVTQTLPACVAPEVLTKKGYSYTIDWWSLGVCAYGLIWHPFRGNTNSHLSPSITREHLKFPEDAEAKCSRDGVHALKSVCILYSSSKSRGSVLALGWRYHSLSHHKIGGMYL